MLKSLAVRKHVNRRDTKRVVVLQSYTRADFAILTSFATYTYMQCMRAFCNKKKPFNHV